MKKYSGALLSLVCIVYTVWYMHFGKPWTNAGALSTIGLRHRALFTVWGLLTLISLTTQIMTGYIRIGRLKTGAALMGTAAVGMALTLIFRFDYDIKPDYYLHCAGSLLFSAVTGVSVFLLFALKKEKTLAGLTALILTGDLICLLIFKETGLIEALPIIAGLIMLTYSNLRRDGIEASRKAEIA
ncbi:MAG: hypothetical protein K6C14_02235 [Eubacterium sp.]|nr:hypothetical protein [Eubacterium sp.]